MITPCNSEVLVAGLLKPNILMQKEAEPFRTSKISQNYLVGLFREDETYSHHQTTWSKLLVKGKKQLKEIGSEWSLHRGVTAFIKKIWKKWTSKELKLGKMVKNFFFHFGRSIPRKASPTGISQNEIHDLLPFARCPIVLKQELEFLLLSSKFCLRMARQLEIIPLTSFLHLLSVKMGPLTIFTDGSVANGGLSGSFGIYAGLRSPLTCSVSLISIGDALDSNYAEKIAIIYTLKKILAMGMDTRPVIIFTDDAGLVTGVNALKTKYRRFHLFEKEMDIVSETLHIIKRLLENVNNPNLSRALQKKLNGLMGRCAEKNALYKRSQNLDLSRLFQFLHRALKEIKETFPLSTVEQRLTLIYSLPKWLCSHCAYQESNANNSPCNKKCSKQYINLIYLLAKSCSNGCVLVHVPGHSDILQNEFADFLAHLGHSRSSYLSLEEIIAESWESNRGSRKRLDKTRFQDAKLVTAVISYEPLCCGSIDDPASFPVCEEIWDNTHGELYRFFKESMKSDGLNSSWTDNYLQTHWNNLNNGLQSKWDAILQTSSPR